VSWVVPTLHPAFLLRGAGQYTRAVIVDLARAMRIAAVGRPEWDEGTLYTTPGPRFAAAWLAETRRARCRVGVDVENEISYRGRAVLTHVGVSRGYDGDARAPDRSSLCVWLRRRDGKPTFTPGGEALARGAIRDLLGDPRVAKVLQNGSHDVDVLAWNGLGPVNGYGFDTLVAHQACHPEEPHSLGYLATRYTDAGAWKEEVKGGGGLQRVNEVVVRRYNALDAAVTLALAPRLEADVARGGPAVATLFRGKMQVAELARRIGARGLWVDQERLAMARDTYADRLRSGRVSLGQLSGQVDFDPQKPIHLREALYGRFRAPIVARTPKTRAPTLSQSLLPRLRPYLSPEGKRFIDSLLAWKSSAKIESTYLREGWRDSSGRLHGVEIIDGSVHSLFSVTVTPTDRWASREPNLQNIPTGDPNDPVSNIRGIYTARPGFTLVGFDFAALELRIDAFQSGDEPLMRMFAEDLRLRRLGVPKARRPDIHRVNAAAVFGVPEGSVTKSMRDTGKNVIYGVGYGGGAQTILGTIRANAEGSGNPAEIRAAYTLTVVDVEAMLRNWFATHPGLARHRKSKVSEALERSRRVAGLGLGLGWCQEYRNGRRRWFLSGRVPHGGWDGGSDRRGNPAATQVLNAPVQTEASIVFDETMLALDSDLRRGRFGAWSLTAEAAGRCAGVVIPLHDAIYLEVPTAYREEAVSAVREHGERPRPSPSGEVVYPVDVKCGRRWSDVS